jgi:thiamine biosynthesis lipoprotein
MRFLLLLLLLLPPLLACDRSAPTPRGVVLSGRTMGTSYHVRLDHLPRGVSADRLQAEIDARLDTVNDQMSTYRPGSELSRFNRAPADAWFAVSSATAQVVAAALKVSEQAGGAFDPTVGPLVDLWHFGPGADIGEVEPPSPAAIEAAKQAVGYRSVAVRLDPPALRKHHAGTRLDLSAIAKGYAVDVIAEYLASLGVKNHLVEIGGEVRAAGESAAGRPWRVGIEKPLEDARGIYKVVALRDAALATSGGYRNFFVSDGRRYSHTIDPRTGSPVEHNLASVSVLADDCMTADAWATALMVLGPKAGYEKAKQLGLAALLLVEEDGRFMEHATPAWDDKIMGAMPSRRAKD